MPVAKIHVHEGAFRDSELATIGTAVQAALEEVLSVPPEDYFRITHVLPKGQFVHTPAFVGCTYSERLVLLELTFISGRPKDQRLALLAALNQLVVEKVGLRPDDLVVLIYEMPGENISFGQGLAQRARISASASPRRGCINPSGTPPQASSNHGTWLFSLIRVSRCSMLSGRSKSLPPLISFLPSAHHDPLNRTRSKSGPSTSERLTDLVVLA